MSALQEGHWALLRSSFAARIEREELCKRCSAASSPAHAILFQTAQHGAALAMHGRAVKSLDPPRQQTGTGCYYAVLQTS
eukprot:19860-Heterococcus_DN1.PRE.2